MKTFKILVFLFLLSILSVPSFGQTGKGKILIGTGSNLGFTSTSSRWKSDSGSGDNGSSSSFGLSPKIGYFITDQVALGAEFQFLYSASKNSSKSHSVIYGLGPFARYYYGNEKLKPFLGAGLGFGGDSYKSTSGNNTIKANYSIFNFNLEGGLAYFLNDKVSADLGISYNFIKEKDQLNNPTNYRTSSGTLTIGAGFHFFIF